MNDRMPFETSILCFLAGGIAGATAVFLWAPQSGRATRETIARKFGDGADRVLQKGRQIRGEAAHRVSEAASALSGDGHELGGKPEKSASV